MIPKHMQAMYCLHCHDKKHVDLALSDTRRALRHLEQVTAHTITERPLSHRTADDIVLHTPLRKMCGGMCTEIGRTEHDLRRLETNLSQVVGGLFAWLKTADPRDPKTVHVRSVLSAHLRGRYPRAARMLHLIRAEGENARSE